jgi:hypothetical protein
MGAKCDGIRILLRIPITTNKITESRNFPEKCNVQFSVKMGKNMEVYTYFWINGHLGLETDAVLPELHCT